MTTQSMALTHTPTDIKSVLTLAAGTYEVQFTGQGVSLLATAATAPLAHTKSARRLPPDVVRRITIGDDGEYAWVNPGSGGYMIVDPAAT